ncbi:3-oxoacyl-(acyl-carrier-protein) synthase [Mucilaginibacter frigoritolerans]|uniref:3-oxoacyl-(Acyl-carrier-protein) synthase n=1 Tax=Mucilaginibacter frigoritolerans TaxID=652788 RepID=A0A562TSB3_9SPHI|nr:beta-ketoacyl-[acyl-carrier-protein] synthase family protein [Mucilaginibacter frigoritolerans]TWI96363.1 3-oxoacyl-(acyl-carrier-protein) synthase [Mucilaginibacter frigoritolerans]
MTKEGHITSSCVISSNTVYKNGKHLFINTGADVPDFLNSIYKYFDLSYSRFYKMDSLSKLGWLASEILLKDTFEKDKYKPEDVGLILSNANASLDTDMKYLNSVSEIPSPSLFVYTLPNIVTGEICIRNNFKGEDAFFIFENFNARFLENYVSNLLTSDILQACICGWVELVDEDYKAALFLIEKDKSDESISFTKEHLNMIFDNKKAASANLPEVYIAGVGVISAIGNNVAECITAFEHEKAGIGDITHMQTIHRNKLPVAEVGFTNEELAQITGLPVDISRTTMLGVIAAKEALQDAAIPDLSSLRTGFVSANTVGGMDKSEAFFIPFLADNKRGKLRNVFDHECGSVTEAIADELKIKDYMTTISTACSSSANSIFYGARLIKNGLLDVVVAGGADALTKFTLNGFNTLMILDKGFCKPFDENRQGLNLGEGAGYVVLVSEKVAKNLNKQPYCKLSGYNNSNDAYHQTASSPDGTGSYLAMKGALEKANLQPSDIDYINLHGTGTPNNDSAEGTAVKRLFDSVYPAMSSTKSFTGHTLGASGGIEAVFSALAVKYGLIYPNLRFETQMKEVSFSPETKFQKGKQINHVMSNSFGFGGNCSSLIFSKI